MRRKSSWAEFGVENEENSTERGAPFVIGSSRKNRTWPNWVAKRLQWGVMMRTGPGGKQTQIRKSHVEDLWFHTKYRDWGCKEAFEMWNRHHSAVCFRRSVCCSVWFRINWREDEGGGRVSQGGYSIQVTVACIAKKSVDSRGEKKGESWQEIGSGRMAVKRRQVGRQLETTKKRVLLSKEGGVLKKPEVSVVKAWKMSVPKQTRMARGREGEGRHSL